MPRMLSCREVGMECDFVARGETDQDVMQAGAEHGRQAHGFTAEQLADPQLQQRIRGLTRDAS